MAPTRKCEEYEPLRLSPPEKAEVKRVATSLVRETCEEYETYDRRVPRQLNQSRWKAVHSKETLTVHQERCPKGGDGRPIPLICTGSLYGHLDDVMYGLAMVDDAALMQTVSYNNAEVEDVQTLELIDGPTPDQPFRCLKVAWHLFSPPKAMRTVMNHRDMVYIMAFGVTTLSNGERVGYFLNHAIDLAMTPPRTNRKVHRTRISTCSIFKQVSERCVDVYVKAYYQSVNKNLQRLVLRSVSNALMTSCCAVACSEGKKLSWLCAQEDIMRGQRVDATGYSLHRAEDSIVCSACHKRFNAMRKKKTCHLCKMQVCRGCSTKRQKNDVLPYMRLVKHKVHLCNGCNRSLKQENAYKVARQDILSGRFDDPGRGTTMTSTARLSMYGQSIHGSSRGHYDDDDIAYLENLSPSKWNERDSYIDLASEPRSSTTDADRSSLRLSSMLINEFTTFKDDDDWDSMIADTTTTGISAMEQHYRKAWADMTKRRVDKVAHRPSLCHVP